MSPVLGSVDLAFRTIIDEACELFKAEAAQDTKEVIHELDFTLKCTSFTFHWPNHN
jgi:hypothetical protein